MSLFCYHKWKLLDKTILPSRVEVAKKNGFEITEGSRSGDLIEKIIIIYTCEHCGKLHKIIETS